MLDKLISAWRFETRLCNVSAPIEADVEFAFREALPSVATNLLIPLFRRTAGVSIAEGNTVVYRPIGPYPSAAISSSQLRGWKWPIPKNVTVFGDNGCGEQFGIWEPIGAGLPLIVEIAEPSGENAEMSVVGTNLTRFLLGRTVYYFMVCDASATALDILGVPEAMRDVGLDDEGFDAIMRWADPQLPKYSLSPYEAQLDAIDVEAISRGSS
jgi:hypothetical protein